MRLSRSALYYEGMQRSSIIFRILCLILVTILPAVPDAQSSNASAPNNDIQVYLIRHAWHAGIVLHRAHIDTLSVLSDFPEAKYLEIGWGDADFYMNPDPGVWITVKAAIFPTTSTLHVAGFQRPITEFFPGTDVIRLTLPRDGFAELLAFLERSFARNRENELVTLGEGLYGTSAFYKGSEFYYGFKNCNTWVARAFRQAGVPFRPIRNLTVDQLLKHARQYGTVIQ